jgi:exopolyphosphatase/pppGpp-phosphohydrolase
MVKGREDTILAGTLILKAVMGKIGVTQVTVSDRGLRYGLVLEFQREFQRES